MDLDRARVVAVITTVRDIALAEREVGVVRILDVRGYEIVRRACAMHAVGLGDWDAAIDGDAELARLFVETFREVSVEQPDPGPYDQIPRESPTGAPEAEREDFEPGERRLARPRR